MRLHYIDEGQGNEVVLMLHGGPSWSFMFRKVVPSLVAKGHRVICPDALGMGKSDKPVDPARYSYMNHAAAVAALCDRLGLSAGPCTLTVVLHDWGGVYSLPALPKIGPERIVLLNTPPGPGTLPKCGTDWHNKFAAAFWFAAARAVGPDLCLSTVIRSMSSDKEDGTKLEDAVVAGYEAPHPSAEYKALVATWPCVYAGGPGKMKPHYEAAQKEMENYTGAVLIAMGAKDHTFNGRKAEPRIREWLSKARVIERTDIENGGHYTTENAAGEVAAAIGNFIEKHP